MNTDIQTAPTSLTQQAFLKLQALKTVASNAAILLPVALVTFVLMQSRYEWPHSQLFMTLILGLMVTDFLMLFLIEQYRQELGDLTIPGILAFIGVTILFTMTEALDRFVISYGFRWLTPVVVIASALIYAGVFREKHGPMKLFLCVNGLALTALWCLADAGGMALPF